jgi:hypothetical protein
MGKAGGELKAKKGEERGMASGRSAKRANGQQPLARNAISCRYFGSGLGGALAWKGAAKPPKNGISILRHAQRSTSLFHKAPKSFVVST